MIKEAELTKQIADLQAQQEAVTNRVGNVLHIAITLATGHHAADAHATTEGMTGAYWRDVVVTAEAIYDNISNYIDANVVPKAQEDIATLDAQINALMQEQEAEAQRRKLMGGKPKKIVTLN